MQENKNIVVEQSGLFGNLGLGNKFNIPDNYVIYFEKEQNKELSLYIRSNYERLKSKFAANNLNFIYFPLISTSSTKIQELISYYFPQLNYYQIPEKVADSFNEKMLSTIFNNFHDEINFISDKNGFVPTQVNTDELLNTIVYEGNIRSGLIFFKFNSGVIGISDYFYSNSNHNYELFFDEVIQYLSIEEWVDFALGNADFSIDLSFLPTSYSEQLDDDTKEVIKDIEHRLTELKNSGQLLFLIPILKDLLNKQSQKIDFNSISKMEIDSQNKIQLPYFKKEVELSHLTKAIYFLFLKHPEGINLKELGNYKKELLTIYTSISNQLDYNKMAKSIDDVINIETKAIYTHLSRIKSAFYKIMDTSFAKYYIVSGSGENERIVLFNTKDIIWNNYERFTPDML
jgi:hypothetical protein